VPGPHEGEPRAVVTKGTELCCTRSAKDLLHYLGGARALLPLLLLLQRPPPPDLRSGDDENVPNLAAEVVLALAVMLQSGTGACACLIRTRSEVWNLIWTYRAERRAARTGQRLSKRT
jgi:hypothetical protein